MHNEMVDFPAATVVATAASNKQQKAVATSNSISNNGYKVATA